MEKKLNLANIMLLLPATFLLISSASSNIEQSQLFYEEETFNNLNYFKIYDTSSKIEKSSNYYEVKYKFEFATINTSYRLLFTYLDGDNNEVIYDKEININDYITSTNKIYELDVKIPLTSLNDFIKFNFTLANSSKIANIHI